MQISSVSYVNLAEPRDAGTVTASDDAELKSQGSSLAALSEPTESDDSGRQSEQKPSQDNATIELTEQELQQIRELEARDREVRAHEQAHQSAGGQYTGAASYTYQRGPDGVRYAIGGEVPIDTSKIEGDPEATIDKAEVVRRAALAPAEPSAQDRQVAALASQIKLEAQAELAAMRSEDTSEADDGTETDSAQSESSETDSASESAASREASAETNSSDSQDRGDSEKDESSGVEFVDASLSPEDLTNLLASEIARRNAMAVFENINRDPPKGNLDELV
jgi:hypothetical protein